MKPHLPLGSLALLLALVLALPLAALADPKPAGAPDPDLPQAFDTTVVAPVVQSSPFTRMVNMSDNLVLTGIANIQGKPVATIFNKETKESYVVSEEPNSQGWKLNEAMQTPDITRSQAKITIGGEVVSVRYDASAMTAANMKKDKAAPSSGGGPRPEGGGDDRFRRSGRGPSEEDRKRFETLSDGAKEKFRNMMREKFSDEKFRNAPEDERRNLIRREFEKIESQDKKGGR